MEKLFENVNDPIKLHKTCFRFLGVLFEETLDFACFYKLTCYVKRMYQKKKKMDILPFDCNKN